MSSRIFQSFGQNIQNSVGQAIQQAANTASHVSQGTEELHIRGHTVLVKEKLAEGGFGLIQLVEDPHSQRSMVLKRCNIDRSEVFATVKKEISILQRFAGPYIVKLIESDTVMKNYDSREALLLLEYCPGGHLLDRLNERRGAFLPPDSIYRIFGQLLLALKNFHENSPPIIHRDLKLENILFAQDGKLQLCDFGSCMEAPIYIKDSVERANAEEAIQKETTQMYRAPEMVNLYMRDVLTEKTDIWALGCIFYALCFLKHPFQDMGSLGILGGKINIPSQSPVNANGHELLLRMLDIDPEARPSVSQLIAAVKELAYGRPLPPYELSAEALQRRQERLAANEVRQSKAKKKPATILDIRKGAPPSANSVAAKRLAAKRGQPIQETTQNHDLFSSDNSISNKADFSADFNVFNDNDDFEPGPIKAAPASASFDAFGETESAGAASFDPFSDSPSNQGFPVSNSHAIAATNSFSAFEDDVAATEDTFDPFAAAPETNVNATAKPRVRQSAATALFDIIDDSGSNNSNNKNMNDQFDPFSSTSGVTDTLKTTPPSRSSSLVASSSTFDPFDNQNISTKDDFDAFAPNNSSSSDNGKAFQGFDMFDNSPAPKASANKSAATVTGDPFSTSESTLIDFGSNLPAIVELKPAPAPSSSQSLRGSLIDDLLDVSVAPSSTSYNSATPAVASRNNALDVLSLYDQPQPPKPPKPAMLGLSPAGGPPPMQGPPRGMYSQQQQGPGMMMMSHGNPYHPSSMPQQPLNAYNSAPAMIPGGGPIMGRRNLPPTPSSTSVNSPSQPARSADPFDSLNLLKK